VAPFGRPAGILLVVDPDLIPAALLARAVGRVDRLVVDVHEDYAAVASERRWIPDVARSFVAGAASVVIQLAKYADVVVVADDYLAPSSGRRRIAIDNRPTIQPATEERRRHTCVYVGDVTSSRGVAEMIRCLELSPKWTLDLIGPIPDPDMVQSLISSAGVADRIRLHGRLEPANATAIMRSAEVGLVLLADTQAYRAAAPSKLYEYFEAGLAVIGTSLPRISHLLAESQGGVPVPDGAGAAAVLAEWTRSEIPMRVCQRSARYWAERNLLAVDPFDQLFREEVGACIHQPDPNARM
jgi:glycosyltransferase involved in cell wall biosynthesis